MFKRYILASAGLLIAMLNLCGCSSSGGGSGAVDENLLRILNWEDYIYENDPEDPESAKDLMDQFVDYIQETEGREIKYVYDTFDTNETMFNELKTGKSDYDLIVPSDYMIQKMIASDMLEPLDDQPMSNVDDYISPYLKEKFEEITIADNSGSTLKNEDGSDVNIYQYSRPYMWGTVGLIYNPGFKAYADFGEEKVHEDFADYSVLYNSEYKNTASIKDSVRDVYAVSIVNVYREEIMSYQAKLDANEITATEYNAILTQIFNRCDDETIQLVQDDMLNMKANSFGFEVDSGKTDIVTGKIGANIAWSGDAVWSMFDAEDESLAEADRQYLYFSNPTIGSNIWFDGLCMPKSDTLNKSLAEKFIDFLFNPQNAAQNMDCVGYTPGVAGQDILDIVYDLYDVREYDEASESYVLNPDYEEGVDYIKYDLSYFFGDTVDEGAAILDANPDYVDRELTAQFPKAEVLPYLAVMSDFGAQNSAIIDMWEVVKTNSLPVWAIVVFSIEGAAAVGLIVFFAVKAGTKKKLRKKRREERLS